jgi:hypothetical protein
MAIIGFILTGLLLAAVSVGWFFTLIFDGSVGGAGRQIPLWIMIGFFLIIIWLWTLIFEASPFTVVITG